jgi:predicted O-methyltransferase YrrM
VKKLLKILKPAAPIFDVLLSPLTFLAAIWFRIAKFWGLKRLRVTRALFLNIGMAPLVDHYYEPLFDYRKLPLARFGEIKSIDLQIEHQLSLLKRFNYQADLKSLPIKGTGFSFYYDNGSFPSGDAELYYSIIRFIKPSTIIEVGAGFSTLMALEGIKNLPSTVNLICIEPFEHPELNSLPIDIKREMVENVELDFFKQLKANDILFIDTSHILRPGGDVMHLFLKVLPQLNSGVWVHIHDIFYPNEYPVEWLRDEFRLWNEQYLLMALLCNNPSFEVMFSLSYLKENYFEEVSQCFPILAVQPDRNPGSFWIRKV